MTSLDFVRLLDTIEYRYRNSILGESFSFLSFCLSGSQLQICPSGLTCCTEQMEQKLWSVSKDQYGKRIQSETGSIQRLFNKRGKKFDGKNLTDVFQGSKLFASNQSACYLSCYLDVFSCTEGEGKNCRFDG